jgi:stage III sporulation protein AG
MAAEANSKEQKKKSAFQRLAENDTYRKIAVGGGILGIFLIALSGSLKGCSSTQNSAALSSSSSAINTISAESYEKLLEDKLTNIISQINGAGNVRVMVTLEQTTKDVYATEVKTDDQEKGDNTESGSVTKEKSNSREEKYLVIKDENGAEKVVQVTEIQPLVKGVVVVCDGGDDLKVQKDITTAVTTALNITSVHVCVIKAK